MADRFRRIPEEELEEIPSCFLRFKPRLLRSGCHGPDPPDEGPVLPWWRREPPPSLSSPSFPLSCLPRREALAGVQPSSSAGVEV